MRASVAVEKLGLPTASLVCQGFETQGSATAAGLGMRNLPMAIYPGHVNVHSSEKLQENVEKVLIDRIVQALSVQPKETIAVSEPAPRDIVFKGSFEEVNKHFYEKEWSEGIPIVPPTIDKVEEFLKFTSHPANHALGVLLPLKGEATVWSVAVNGVMAGCRPEYMPVLVAIVEAMAEPKFGVEHLGNTPGTEILITINGPIIKELGFNYEQGALRVGYQANTSIGRFFRLYLRNVAGFLPRKTDKATFGGTWRLVLAENEDALAKIGWEPMSVDQGFKTGDNVITLSSCTASDSTFSAGLPVIEKTLDKLSARIVDIQLYLFFASMNGPSVRPQVLMSPCVAEAIAKAGYSKKAMKQYFFEHALFPVSRWEHLFHDMPITDGVKRGVLPAIYAKSSDPDRMVPIVWSPDDFLITVSGDPNRDNCFICAQNGFIGYPTSKKIQLPPIWEQLLKESKTK